MIKESFHLSDKPVVLPNLDVACLGSVYHSYYGCVPADSIALKVFLVTEQNRMFF